MTHDKAVQALTRVFARADEADMRDVVKAAAHGISDGSLSLAIIFAANEAFDPDRVRTWRAR